ncbi:MAG TPA: T9SS type A sorting domain-containing protein [Flavipsychrobacter sp.]|nr:T9SS type A sorting domain-containing protein [Flavipsychrobacter sp.]
MKRLILGLSALIAFGFTAVNAYAQSTFSTPHDTVAATFNGSTIDLHNDITAIGSPSQIYWKSAGTNFPASWSTNSSVSVCDNNTCLNNQNNNMLNGSEYLSAFYQPGVPGLFKASFDLTTGVSGTYYVNYLLRDSASGDTKTITFVVTKFPTSAGSLSKNNDEVTLYPNPATDDLNVVFGANDGVKNIAVYNVIGKAIVVYKVAGNSAKMDISRLPNGVYFLRLSDAKGQVVSTKRFTKQ